MHDWKPYVSVAQRRAAAAKHAKEQAKKGVVHAPVVITGRKIATSFWGKAWCDNLESYSDYSNRLPRGRTYARNGSVVDLQLEKGVVRATVSGSSLYSVRVEVQPLGARRWAALVERHASKVSSVVDLLQGKLPASLLAVLADRASGLFPAPKELKFSCSCPDWATMCKHVAAVLYGVGSRLDSKPDLFFLLRGVEVAELAARGAAADFSIAATSDFASEDLGALFGIELADDAPTMIAPPVTKRPTTGTPLARATRTVAKTATGKNTKTKTRAPTKAGPTKAAPTKAAPTKAAPTKAAPTKAAPTTRTVSTAAKTITAAELRERRVPPSTSAAWVRTGVLERTAQRGVYRLTANARGRLAGYGGS